MTQSLRSHSKLLRYILSSAATLKPRNVNFYGHIFHLNTDSGW